MLFVINSDKLIVVIISEPPSSINITKYINIDRVNGVIYVQIAKITPFVPIPFRYIFFTITIKEIPYGIYIA